jgi:hypothetical protein
MTGPRKYVDLSLELRNLDLAADRFEVALLSSPEVGNPEPVQVPYALHELQDALDDLERKRLDPDDLFELGKGLADRLLPTGGVREPFERVLDKAGLDGGVRLRLIFRSPKLAQVPWEFSYLQRHGKDKAAGNFLVLNPQISIVRHEALPEEYPALAGQAPDHLRMVFAMASPEGYPKLKLSREKGVIEEALSDFRVEGVTIEWEPILENVTEGDLTKSLQAGAQIFHFAGHGTFQDQDIDEETGEITGVGQVALAPETEGGAPRILSAIDLAPLVQQAGVRLAVFGACDSGRRDGVSAWTGIAPALMSGGIPAVVAMQYEVLDYQATAFMEAFYSALASGLTADEAVALGRQAMRRSSNQRDSDWGVPVLYMRSPDGVIFPKLSERETPTALQLRHTVDQVIETIEETGEVVGVKLTRSGGTIDASVEVRQEVDTVKGKLTGIEL